MKLKKLNKIKSIVNNTRLQLEKEYDWNDDKSCFANTCSTISEKLVNKFKENNIYAYRVNGLYNGASEEYVPDTEGWDDEDRWAYYDATEAETFGFNHWWVVAENKYIVDITADQFHPDEEHDYRIVITNINDSDYNA